MFLVFEGSEGVGKSTQAARLADWLRAQGRRVFLTREPGGTPLAEDIRKVFKEKHLHGDEPMPYAELLLVMASRAQHVHHIKQKISQGYWVICDRFLDSSYVYQGFCKGIPLEYIDAVAKPFLGDLCPDITFVLTLPWEKLEKRLKSRLEKSMAAVCDRFDSGDASVHQMFHHGFLRLISENKAYPNGKQPKRCLIDASGSVEDVFLRIQHEVLAMCSERGISIEVFSS